jgi:hypothetical protein
MRVNFWLALLFADHCSYCVPAAVLPAGSSSASWLLRL